MVKHRVRWRTLIKRLIMRIAFVSRALDFPAEENVTRLCAVGSFISRPVTCAALSFLLQSCSQPLSPSVPFFGAYFPSWLICSFVGIVGAILIRVAFVRSGLDDALPGRLIVYACLASTIAFGLALFAYGR
jgi:hypothetical protein